MQNLTRGEKLGIWRFIPHRTYNFRGCIFNILNLKIDLKTKVKIIKYYFSSVTIGIRIILRIFNRRK